MEPLVFGLCMWLLLQVSQQDPMLDRQTRRANRERVHEFIEDKLIEHGQALELILTALKKNEELTRRLLDNFSLRLSPPQLPENIEKPVQPSGRRANEQVAEHPVLAKIGVTGSIAQVTSPVSSPIASQGPRSSTPIKVDPWCRNAAICKATSKDPVCGFDDKFGIGKFDNICHMINVNCFWKHNFTLVSCNQKVRT